MSDEKRRFTRIPFKVQAEMTVDGMLYRVEEVENLSVGGCLLLIKNNFDQGSPCRLKILLGGPTSEVSIIVDGEIVRYHPGAVAIKFVQISPDSLFHLQNILRYNSPDTDVIEREISDHPGLV